jgi:hypothetical protein
MTIITTVHSRDRALAELTAATAVWKNMERSCIITASLREQKFVTGKVPRVLSDAVTPEFGQTTLTVTTAAAEVAAAAAIE